MNFITICVRIELSLHYAHFIETLCNKLGNNGVKRLGSLANSLSKLLAESKHGYRV